jgi:TPR repeat protein
MTKLVYSSETSGRGATIELDSQETCLVSVAQSWVFVKSCRGKYRRILLGLLGTTLFNQIGAPQIARTAAALNSLFPEKRIPINFRNPVLGAFANAIWHCSTAAEVTVTLNEAIARAEGQAMSDAEIVSDYATFITEATTRVDCFYDVNVLPHPKDAIIAAIGREIIREPLEARVEWLRSSTVFLWNFLDGIGPDPLPLKGGLVKSDLSQLSQGVTPSDGSELRRIITSREYKGDVERSERFTAIAVRENKQIEERIATAIHIRSKQLAGLSQAEKSMLDAHEGKFNEFLKSNRAADFIGGGNRRSADPGDPEAQLKIGNMYVGGHGVPEDYAEAARWYAKAALGGNVKAQSQLGLMYTIGLGVTQDYAEAVKWCRKAAERGDARAQGQLGDMYVKGQGVQRDYEEAARWSRSAAEQGNAEAQVSLGLMYVRGQGVPEDYVQAYKWFSLAYASGHKLSVEGRDLVAEKMTAAQIAEARMLAQEWTLKSTPR